MMHSFEGNLLTQRHEICRQQTRDPTLPCVNNPESLSGLGLNRYPVVTDGQTDERTDGIMIASTRLALRALRRNKKSELMLMRRATASV